MKRPTAITHIVSHADCPDGIASAMVCRAVFPDAKVSFVQYGQPSLLELPAEPGMLFVDMTPPRDRVDEFLEAGAWVLDHHVKARDITDRFVAAGQGVFRDEPGVAGANIAYETLPVHREHLEALVQLAGIRDTWQSEHPLWEKACAQAAVLMFYGPTHWLAVKMVTGPDLALGYHLLEKRRRDVVKAAERARVRTGMGCCFAIFNDKNLVSDVAELFRGRGVPVSFGFRYGAELEVSCRSNHDYDVGDFAKEMGGGGHSRAAGFTIEVDAKATNPFEEISRRWCHFLRR